MAESRGSLSDSDGFKNNIVSALQLAKAELETKHEKANFIRIIMRFPKIRAVFDRLRAIHARCDKSGDGEVDMEELTEAMTELFNEGRAEGRDPIKPAVVARTLSISEVEEVGGMKTKGLDVKQFIVMCAIGFILAEENKDLSTFGGMLAAGDDAYRSAMSDVVTAYLSFDREGKGYFTADEFNGFMTASKRADAAKSFFTYERWAELDVTGDGKVEFEEFVYAFSKWISDDDEEDDEEDEGRNRTKNPLTPRVTLALQLSKSVLDKQKKDVNFTRIIMRFPKIHQVFDRILSTHAKYDVNGDGKIQLRELTDAMKELMNASEEGAEGIDMQQVENIFMLSDLDHHGLEEGLDAKEFIVFCAVGFIIAEAGGSKSNRIISDHDKELTEEYHKAMMDIVGAYLTFDREGKGYFTSDEMHTAVQECGKKDAGTLLTPERWRELDIDHSGRVDFEEFVHAFSTWVTAGDDEDE